MTFDGLRDELSARGYSHLSSARLGSLINRAYHRLNMTATWPYREDSAQGAAPLSIPTLGEVEAVSDETNEVPLEGIGYADLVEWGCDLGETGAPQYWYRSMPAGEPVVNVWPSSSSVTIGVQFWSVPPEMSADSDEPLVPERYHMLIVDLAQQMAERERGNFQAASLLQQDVDRQIQEMKTDLLAQQAPRFMRLTGASEDW